MSDTILFKHGSLQCEIIQDTPRDALDMAFTYIDLGIPGDKPNEISGPRIACRRTTNNKGWRLYLHAESGDEFHIFTITDRDGETAPIVTREEP